MLKKLSRVDEIFTEKMAVEKLFVESMCKEKSLRKTFL